MSETIEGRNPVLEALRSGSRIERVLVSSGLQSDPVVSEILKRAKDAGVRVDQVQRAELDRRSARGAHQGVIALAAPFEYAALEEVLAATVGKKRSLIVVFDHITDPGNLGAAIRSIEVAGGDAVVIPRDRSASVGQVVHKASAGATSYLPVVQVSNVASAIASLKDAGYWVAGADERAEDTLWKAPLEGRLALVLGAEGAGLSRLVRERCDFLVSIPMAGHVASLNVAQAATLLAFEWVRRES